MVNFCWEAERYAERRIRRARRSTSIRGMAGDEGFCATLVYRNEAVKDFALPSPGHTSGSVTTSPEWAADIQSLVAAVGMVVRSGMSNTALRSIRSATGMT